MIALLGSININLSAPVWTIDRHLSIYLEPERPPAAEPGLGAGRRRRQEVDRSAATLRRPVAAFLGVPAPPFVRCAPGLWKWLVRR